MPGGIPNIAGAQLETFMVQQGQGEASRLQRMLGKKNDDASLRKASQEFEAIFVKQLLTEMRKALPKEGFFKQSMAREWFEGMLDDAISQEVSRGPGIGLAAPLYEQMRQMARKGAKPETPAVAAPPAPKSEEKKP